MSLADELLKLEELRNRGTLNDSEFQQAKSKLLDSETKPNDLDQQRISEQLAELQRQANLAQIDRAWELERQQHLITSRYGNHIPTRGSAFAGIVIGALLTSIAIVLRLFADDRIKHSSDLFWVLLIPGLVWFFVSIFGLRKVRAYEKAFRHYQQRRMRAFQESPVSRTTTANS